MLLAEVVELETRDAAQWLTVHRTAPITVIQSKEISIMVRLTNAVPKLICVESQKIGAGKEKTARRLPHLRGRYLSSGLGRMPAHAQTCTPLALEASEALPVCARAWAPRGLCVGEVEAYR